MICIPYQYLVKKGKESVKYLMFLFTKFHYIIYISKIIMLWIGLNLDRGHCFPVIKYDGGGPFRVSGVFPCVSKHKMLPNLIGKKSGDCLTGHSPQCAQRGQGLSLVSKEDKTETVRLWCIDSVLTPVFVWLASMETDTLISILSETKIGNRSHNNRCVTFMTVTCCVLLDSESRQHRGQRG